MTAEGNHRIRIRFAKLGRIRFISHRDLARVWERALRRAELPVAYSQGYSPHPRISFGLALATGYESIAEYLDVEVEEEVPLEGLVERLAQHLPSGVQPVAVVRHVPGEPSLQEAVTSCTWHFELPGVQRQWLEAVVADLLARKEIPIRRNRKGTEIDADLRPGIRRLRVEATPSGCQLTAELNTGPEGARPEELVRAIGDGLDPALVRRTHQWIDRDGTRREPVPANAPPPSHAKERAS